MVVSDAKFIVSSDNVIDVTDILTPEIVSATDYYPFGMPMNDRKLNSADYRYGFNGKENDQETGNQDYGMRIYNPDIAKFLSVDPLFKQYPWYTPYQFAGNKPIKYVDIDGLEEGERAAKAGEALFKATDKAVEDACRKAGLGPHQILVVKANPIDAFRSRNSNNLAYSIQKSAGFGFREDGSGDAFRHTYWNALMKKSGNRDFAKKMGEAHEKDSPNPRKLTTVMDLANNAIGQKLAEDNPKSTEKELALLTLEAVKNGGTYVVEKNEKGEDQLVKSFLTNEEYKSMKKQIESFDFEKAKNDSKSNNVEYGKDDGIIKQETKP